MWREAREVDADVSKAEPVAERTLFSAARSGSERFGIVGWPVRSGAPEASTATGLPSSDIYSSRPVMI